MKQGWFGAISIAIPTLLAAQTGRGSYARIAVLRPNDGKTVEFEAGYLRHLEWHKQAGDPWTWYGWTIWSGDRYRWFVYATFGHSAGSLDSAVTPAEDERDNVRNVEPHVEWVTNGMYEFLPGLSRGTGVPQATPRLEYTAWISCPGPRRHSRRRSRRPSPRSRPRPSGFACWREGTRHGMSGCARGPACRSCSSDAREQPLPGSVKTLIAGTSVEIWNLRPAMSLGLGPPARP